MVDRARVADDHLGIVCQRCCREPGDASARLDAHQRSNREWRPIGGPSAALGAADLGQQCERHALPAAEIEQGSARAGAGWIIAAVLTGVSRRPPQTQAL